MFPAYRNQSIDSYFHIRGTFVVNNLIYFIKTQLFTEHWVFYCYNPCPESNREIWKNIGLPTICFELLSFLTLN